MSEYAPRIQTVKIDPTRIGELIGPGGKNINGLIDRAGGKEVTNIDIEEDGTVLVSSSDPEMAKKVLEEISYMTRTVQVGEIYEGPVEVIIKDKMDPRKEIGAVVELWPGKTGMIHISQVSRDRINLVSDVLQVGQIVKVKVVSVDPEKNRVGLSIKELLND